MSTIFSLYEMVFASTYIYLLASLQERGRCFALVEAGLWNVVVKNNDGDRSSVY